MTLISRCGRLTLMSGCCALITVMSVASALAQQIPLQSIVTPSTVISKDGHPVKFAIHGYIEFTSLAEAFPYIETQTRRWEGNSLP